jgi:hypothetical protein
MAAYMPFLGYMQLKDGTKISVVCTSGREEPS